MPTRRLFIPAAVLFLTAFVGCAHKAAKTRDPVHVPPLPQGPVAAVWFDVGYPPPGFQGEMRRLIVGVWGDGQVVWSDDRARGGKPYRVGRIEPAKVAKLLADLEAGGLFEERREVYFGPDSSYTVIAAETSSKRKWLGSWHDPAPKNPNVVVDEHGLSAVAPGQPRPKPSPEYARFLEVWKRSRELIESAIPTTGEPLETLDAAVFQVGRAKP